MIVIFEAGSFPAQLKTKKETEERRKGPLKVYRGVGLKNGQLSTHNSIPVEILSNCPGARLWAHTWPDHLSDQIGLMVTVEQDHCTLIAVKRYWDTPCVGGRHNFFQRPYGHQTNRKG